jgi:hypothetical protein
MQLQREAHDPAAVNLIVAHREFLDAAIEVLRHVVDDQGFNEMRTDLRRTTAVALGLVALLLAACSSADGQPPTQQPAAPSSVAGPAVRTSHKDTTYEIEGQTVTLVNGASEAAVAPGSASKVVTRYFGNEATGDLNGDGTPDIAFLLTQSRGGSGTFYYVVVALKTVNGYAGTNAVLLGDRIAPQSTLINGSDLIVNFADRKSGEPMTASPSVGVSKTLKVVSGKLVVR